VNGHRQAVSKAPGTNPEKTPLGWPLGCQLLDRSAALPISFPGPSNQRKNFGDRQRMTTMIDEKLARLRTHRNNIARYRCLLKTKLTNLERQFIERRLSEEQSDFERLAAGTFPVTFTLPVPPEPATSHDTTAEVSGGWPSVTPPPTRA
jgi:hypothetical protein